MKIDERKVREFLKRVHWRDDAIDVALQAMRSSLPREFTVGSVWRCTSTNEWAGAHKGNLMLVANDHFGNVIGVDLTNNKAVAWPRDAFDISAFTYVGELDPENCCK